MRNMRNKSIVAAVSLAAALAVGAVGYGLGQHGDADTSAGGKGKFCAVSVLAAGCAGGGTY